MMYKKLLATMYLSYIINQYELYVEQINFEMIFYNILCKLNTFNFRCFTQVTDIINGKEDYGLEQESINVGWQMYLETLHH